MSLDRPDVSMEVAMKRLAADPRFCNMIHTIGTNPQLAKTLEELCKKDEPPSTSFLGVLGGALWGGLTQGLLGAVMVGGMSYAGAQGMHAMGWTTAAGTQHGTQLTPDDQVNSTIAANSARNAAFAGLISTGFGTFMGWNNVQQEQQLKNIVWHVIHGVPMDEKTQAMADRALEAATAAQKPQRPQQAAAPAYAHLPQAAPYTPPVVKTGQSHTPLRNG